MPGRLNVTLLTVLVALIAPGGLQAEVLRFDSRSQWTQWQMPADAIDITSSGGLQPVRCARGTMRRSMRTGLGAAYG